MTQNQGTQEPALPRIPLAPRHPKARWRVVLGMLLTLAIVALAFVNRAWLVEAFGLARAAQPAWLLMGLAAILGSFLISSQVLRVVMRALGHRAGVLRMWATAIVAIVTSQMFPGGGVGSYAFLLSSLRRRGATASEAALVAMLESLSYAGAMVVFAVFGLAYLASRMLAADPDGSSLLAPVLAVGMMLLLIGGAVFLLTRSTATIGRWLSRTHRLLVRVLRRPRDASWIERALTEIARVRALVAERRTMLAVLVLIQLIALSGHSFGLFLILRSLGTTTSFLSVLAAFGIALLTSTVNVLPGGGGTVEAALVAVLTQLGVGAEAVPAAIVFRLLNFWMMLPIAGACYAWLMREQRKPLAR
jgi:uncharacterized protein (TIRG00374 family)